MYGSWCAVVCVPDPTHPGSTAAFDTIVGPRGPCLLVAARPSRYLDILPVTEAKGSKAVGTPSVRRAHLERSDNRSYAAPRAGDWSLPWYFQPKSRDQILQGEHPAHMAGGPKPHVSRSLLRDLLVAIQIHER